MPCSKSQVRPTFDQPQYRGASREPTATFLVPRQCVRTTARLLLQLEHDVHLPVCRMGRGGYDRQSKHGDDEHAGHRVCFRSSVQRGNAPQPLYHPPTREIRPSARKRHESLLNRNSQLSPNDGMSSETNSKPALPLSRSEQSHRPGFYLSRTCSHRIPGASR